VPEPAGPVAVPGRLVLARGRLALGDLGLDDRGDVLLGEDPAFGLASSQTPGAARDVLLIAGPGRPRRRNRLGVADRAQRRPQRRHGRGVACLHGLAQVCLQPGPDVTALPLDNHVALVAELPGRAHPVFRASTSRSTQI
jgi:hypothetical protein